MKRRYADLEYIFHPKSVAVVGVSPDPVQTGLMHPFVTCGFPGEIYPVHPTCSEILGRRAYKSVKDIPGPVDYVVFGTPARSIPSLMEECVVKGVKAASFFTSGFSECGTEEGRRLEKRILEIARRGGMRLIGPNCLGLYCPASGIAFIPDPPLEAGPVGFISQSGGNSVYFIRAGARRGLLFSKVVSYGNGVDIDESELLEYMAGDRDTEIVAAYIEGVKDGRRFQEALRKVASAKPVIVLKAGRTGAGSRSCSSHTGALAGDEQVWDAVIRQSGAIRIDSIDEMVDLAVTFRYMSRLRGPRVGVVGWGGGASVLAADVCQGEGLVLPQFPAALQNRLGEYWLTAGAMLDNPVDTVSWSKSPESFRGIIKSVADWGGIDILILHMGIIGSLVAMASMLKFLPRVVDVYIEEMRKTGKPGAIILHSNATPEGWLTFYRQAKKCVDAGIPVYHSFRGTTRAISRYYEYCSRIG